MKKSLDLYLVSLDVALLVTAISMSFLKSLCEELSGSMVGSFGIHFFTRLDSGEQCTVSPRTVYRIVIKNLTIWMKIHCSSLPICIGRGPKKFKIQTNVNKAKLFETGRCRKSLNCLKNFTNLCIHYNEN